MQLRMSKIWPGRSKRPGQRERGWKYMQSFALNVPQEKILHDLALLLLQARGIPQDERELIVAYNDAVAGLIDAYNN